MGCTIDLNRTVMTFHDAVHRRKPQSDTEALVLGCIKRFEYMALVIRRNTCSGILNGYTYALVSLAGPDA